MKKYLLVILTLAAFCGSAAVAQEKAQPLLRLKIQSFESLAANAKRVGVLAGQNSDWNPGALLSAAIGSPGLAGVDRTRPWQLAVAMKNPGALPLVALYVPVGDFEKFKSGLMDNTLLKGRDAGNPIFQSGEFAVVVFRFGQGAEIPGDDRQKLTNWSPARGGAQQLIELALQMDEAARQQALQAIAMGRMIMTQSITSQKPVAGIPYNPQVLAQIMGLYFDGFETVIKGLIRLEVQMNLSQQAITISKTVQALPNSDLAKMFKSAGGGLGEIANQLDPKATLSFAASIGEKPAFMPVMKKLIRLSFQMQNQELDDKTVNGIEQLMDTLMPMKFIGSVNFGKGATFSGFYEFPNGGLNEKYASIKNFLKDVMPSMTGTNKVYSAFDFKEAHHRSGGTTVDRLNMSINLDSPAFKMPGQKEAIEQFWKGGKMEIDYAAKGNRLYFASPEETSHILEAAPQPQASASLGATPNTAIIGRANILAFVKMAFGVNPMIPAAVREKFGQLNSDGADLRFRVDLDDRLSSRAEIPLKFLDVIRQFRAPEKN